MTGRPPHPSLARPVKQLRVLPVFVCAETVKLLENMTADAKAGRIIGLAVAVHTNAHSYWVDFAGKARADPVSTRGVVAGLDDALAQMVRDAKLD